MGHTVGQPDHTAPTPVNTVPVITLYAQVQVLLEGWAYTPWCRTYTLWCHIHNKVLLILLCLTLLPTLFSLTVYH